MQLRLSCFCGLFCSSFWLLLFFFPFCQFIFFSQLIFCKLNEKQSKTNFFLFLDCFWVPVISRHFCYLSTTKVMVKKGVGGLRREGHTVGMYIVSVPDKLLHERVYAWIFVVVQIRNSKKNKYYLYFFLFFSVCLPYLVFFYGYWCLLRRKEKNFLYDLLEFNC